MVVVSSACPGLNRQIRASGENQPESAPVEAVAATTLGPGDIFYVRVYQEPDLSNLYQVGSDGKIQFPLIGEIDVSGKTPHDSANMIAAALREGYLKEPQVSILVKEYNSKRVYVMGQVEKPGVFAFEDNMNILRVVILAGGFTRLAAKDRVLVTRKTQAGEEQIVVSVEDIGQGKATNISLTPGDIVFVPESIF